MVKDMDQREYLEFISRQIWPGEDKSIEYSWIFEGTYYGVDIPLWESAYCGEKEVLVNSTTLSVLDAYYEKFVCPEDIHMPADYIGYETEFMQKMSASEDFTESITGSC